MGSAPCLTAQRTQCFAFPANCVGTLAKRHPVPPRRAEPSAHGHAGPNAADSGAADVHPMIALGPQGIKSIVVAANADHACLRQGPRCKWAELPTNSALAP